MAQSARLQSLLARRTGSLYGTSGRIRLLNPTTTTISSIAKKAVTSELDIMTKNYNAGTVSNDDFRAFLQKMLTTPGIPDTDKADIRNQVADFDSRITGDRLVQAYKSAPDNTLQQVQAAQSLASYFRGRAAGMQADTPAYNDNIQNAISYEQKVTDIQNNVEKINRQNLRYIAEQKVNKLPSGTSQNAAAKAEMWKQLYDQAITDGDTTAANQYAANYQQAATQADTFATNEENKANKKTLTDFINNTLNDYHDGKISGDDALSSLEQANQFAYNTNDTAALNRLNGLSITINREIDKGITYSSVNGLSQKSKGGGTGGGDLYLNPDGSVSYGGGYTAPTRSTVATKITSGGVGQGKVGSTAVGKPGVPTSISASGVDKPTSFTELDLWYKEQLIEASKELVAGTKTPAEYQALILDITSKRENQLQNVTAGLQNILTQNPKAKLGKTEIQTIFDGYTKELTGVTQENNGIRSGNFVLKMDTNTVKDAAGNEFHVPQLNFVPKSQVNGYINASGIYYPTREQPIAFDSKDAASVFAKNNPDNNGNIGEIIFSPSLGKYTVSDPTSTTGKVFQKKYVDVTDTTGNGVTYEADSKYGWLPVATGPKTGALRNQIVQEADKAHAAGQDYQPNLIGFGQLNNQEASYKNGAWQFNKATPVGSVVGQPTPKQPTGLEQVAKVVAPVTEAVGKVIAPIAAPATPPKEAPLSTLPVNQINVPKNTPVNLPQPAINPTTASIKPQTIAPAAPQPNAIQQAAKQIGPLKVAPPPQTPAPNPFQDFQKNLGNSVFNWFGNLFKKK